jgi:hypothetical protein
VAVVHVVQASQGLPARQAMDRLSRSPEARDLSRGLVAAPCAAQRETATLEVSVAGPTTRPSRPRSPDTGQFQAFSDAGTGFSTGVEALVRLSGRGLLRVLLAGQAYVVGRLAWRTAGGASSSPGPPAWPSPRGPWP